MRIIYPRACFPTAKIAQRQPGDGASSPLSFVSLVPSLAMRATVATALVFVSSVLAVTKPIHSHNDYTRAVPFWTAFNLSVMSVEADVWWQSSQLFVAHTSGDINRSKTLQSLYLDPIMGILNGSRAVPTPISVSNPIQLLIDMKTSGSSTFPPVAAALAPLRAAGHLTTYDAATGTLRPGAVTVVGTGNTPLASVLAQNPPRAPAAGQTWGPHIAPLASVDFGSVASSAQMQELVLNAHDLGIKSRFWNTPAAVGTWNAFWAAGSDWVNADDLLAVSNAWAAFSGALVPTRFEYTGLDAQKALERREL
ncbi:Altered inheritance of mitochondria protein 6 [Mycena indigotica]|uniref:Altered inheritance of mitochondria protein 6 n=1 Tax=Mycena indigotica TaxID=2126181 RepID=A0A8H6S066_9AGAR|nr:Altered inheritance of mitochondria protein 6 [Mycena indigotica]KAF7289815.1 Altered inheritance of mitochondria protein 6 [Mycena indigotica]